MHYLACSDDRVVLVAVAEPAGIAAESFLRQHSGTVSRDLAAWLAWELTPVALQELSTASGLAYPDSLRKRIRRADRALGGCRMLRDEIAAICHRVPKTGNRPRPGEAPPPMS
jgi:hypothetical protein